MSVRVRGCVSARVCSRLFKTIDLYCLSDARRQQLSLYLYRQSTNCRPPKWQHVSSPQVFSNYLPVIFTLLLIKLTYSHCARQTGSRVLARTISPNHDPPLKSCDVSRPMARRSSERDTPLSNGLSAHAHQCANELVSQDGRRSPITIKRSLMFSVSSHQSSPLSRAIIVCSLP